VTVFSEPSARVCDATVNFLQNKRSIDEETAEILDTTTTTTITNNNNNRFSLQLLYQFLKSFMALAVISVTDGHCDGQKCCKRMLSVIYVYTAQIRINSSTFSEVVTTEEELLILSGEGVGKK
jgi:translation initiation factor 2B subunit (eIF-2B alpha/beta/delta family)